MSLYTEIQADVFTWTNRRLMVAETDMAIRGAIRKAHRAGSFYRDLATVTVTGLPTDAQVQTVELSASLPLFRQIHTIFPVNGGTIQYDKIDLRELIDQDGYAKTNVYWIVGTQLAMRPSAPSPSVDITYFKRADVDTLEPLTDWIAVEHKDLIVLWAAATILTLVGEQEVKTRVENLAKLAYDDLISEAIESIGR